MSVKKKLMRNTIYNIFVRSWGQIINVILLPIIIYYVGMVDAGIFWFVLALTGYFSLLDLGISTSLVKFIAEYHAKNDKQRVNEVTNTAFFVFFVIGIIGCIGIILVSTFFLKYFNMDAASLSKAKSLAYIVAIFFASQFSLNIFRNVLAGLQRYDILAKITFVISIFNVITTIIVLTMGYGIIELIFYTLCVSSIGYVITAIYATKHLPFLEIKRIYYSKNMLKTVFSLSMLLLLLWIFVRMIYYTDILVITFYLGPAMIAIYVAAWRIYQIPVKLIDIVSDAMIPASSELDALQKKRALKMLFIRASKYAFAVIVMLGVPTLFLSKQVITYYVGWAGEDFKLYYWVTNILIISIFFDFINHIAHPILIGMNKVKIFVAMYGVIAIMNLTLSIILVQTMNLYGVALGTLIPFVITAPVIVAYYLRVFEVNWIDFIKDVLLKVISLGILVALILFILLTLYIPRNPIDLIVYYVVCISIFVSIFYRFFLEKNEKDDIKLILSRLSRQREKV